MADTPEREPAAPWTAVMLAVVSLAEFHVFAMLAEWTVQGTPDVGNMPLRVAEGITHGEPLFRVWQSRVLGPYLTAAIGTVLGLPFSPAYVFTCMLLVLVKNVATFTSFRAITGRSRDAWFYTLMCVVLCMALQNGVPLDQWDWIDAAVFALVARGIALDASDLYFAGLFAVAIWNRETALFIPVLIGLRAFSVTEGGDAGLRVAVARPLRLAIGAGLLAVGVAVVEGLRTWLFVRGTNIPYLLTRGTGPHVHWKGPVNVKTFVDGFDGITDWRTYLGQMGFLINVLLLALTACIATYARPLLRRAPHLTALVLAMLVSNALFAELHEGRAYVYMTPLLAHMHWILFGEETAQYL